MGDKKAPRVKKYFSSVLRETSLSSQPEPEQTNILCIDVVDEESSLYPIAPPDPPAIEPKKEDTLEMFVDEWKKHTGISCWNCCHPFDNTPLGIPLGIRDSIFRCNGIFCGFPCILRYIKDRHEKRPETLSTMCKVLCGKDITEIKEAPFVRCLKMFGGTLSIEEYRASADNGKIFKYIKYPMHINRDYIEEIDLNNLKKSNNDVFKNGGQATRKRTNILDFLKRT